MWLSPAASLAQPTDPSPEPELHRIDFQAPALCPTAEVFHAGLRSRTPRLQLTLGEQWTSRFEIDVRDEGQRFVGALTVHSGIGSSERREVSAKSCEEVLETLALVVAVAIDPNASLSRRTPAPQARTEAPERAPPPAPAPRVAEARVATTHAQGDPPQASWHQTLALGAEARGTFADDASFAGVASFELERELPDGWGWSLRLSALGGLESTATDPVGREATFGWNAGRVDAAVIAHDEGRVVSLAAGLGFDVGAVEAKSELSETRFWMSALAFLRLRWRPLARLSFETTAGPFVPLTRDEYTLFDPETVVYRERALSGFVSLGVGIGLK